MAAAVAAVHPLHETHVFEPSENWDDDFEFGQDNQRGGDRRPSTSSASGDRKPHINQPHTRPQSPSNGTRRHTSSSTGTRTFSMASSAMEDWDLPETNPAAASSAAAEFTPETPTTENWDDDFEVETRNNSPQKAVLSTPRRRDIREESWDEELESEGKRDEMDPGDDSAEFGFFAASKDEEDRTVTARSRRAALSRLASSNSSPPPPMPFFSSNQPPSPEPFPERSPASSVFSVPNTIRTYSSTTPLVYASSSHLRPTSTFALLPPSPPIHKERERRRLRKKSRPPVEGKFELKDIKGVERCSFSDCEAPGNIPTPRSAMRDRNGRSATPMSDMSSVDECHNHHHVFEPTPPLPTQPSTLATASFPITSAPALHLNLTSLQTPTTPPTKGGTTLLSRIGSVKKWGARRSRGTSSTPSEVIAAESQSHNTRRRGASSTPSDVIAAESSKTPKGDPQSRIPRPRSSMSSLARDASTSSAYASTSNTASSPVEAATSGTAHTHWFFRASSAGSPNMAAQRLGTRPSITSIAKQRRSTSATRTHQQAGDRDAGSAPRISGGPGPTSEWNASRTSLRLAVGLQRESVREQTPSPSPSPVASLRARVSYSGRRPSFSGANTQPTKPIKNVPTTPSKLVKRKSLGFVRLGFGGGSGVYEKEKEKEKYPGLGLGRRTGADKDTADSDEEDQQYGEQRTRRKSFSRLLRDRDKSKDRIDDDVETPRKNQSKEGSRGFMGSVRRISLVGKHRRAQSGGGVFGAITSSPSPSGGGFFHRSSSALSSGKGAEIPSVPVPPLPYSLPPVLSSASQLSLRLPEASGSTYSLHHYQQPLHHPNLHLTSRRIVSASSGQSEGSSVFPGSTISGESGSSYSKGTALGLDLHRTPSGKLRQRTKSRTRKSQDPHREPDLQREGPGSKTNRRSVDFVLDSRLEKGNVDAGTAQKHVLLPPIELQPPSPPHTIAQSSIEFTTATPKGKSKDPNNGTGAKNNTRSLATTLTAFDLHTTSPGSLSPPPSSPLSASALAQPTTPQLASPTTSSSSIFFTPTASPFPTASPNKLSVANVGHSPGKQSASLGRATATGVADGSPSGAGAVGKGAGGSGSAPRRNSLGDLKIPARISQAQVGLRRDLGMVREFATNVEQLKELQQTYQTLVTEVQRIIESHLLLQPPTDDLLPFPPATSPGFFSNLKAKTRGRSNTNPTASEVAQSQAQREQQQRQSSQYKEMASAFYTLNSKYRISWECAELLIELGGGGGGASATTNWNQSSVPPKSSSSMPLGPPLPGPGETRGGMGASAVIEKKRSRDRAITLAGDEAKPTPMSSIPTPATATLSVSTSSAPSNNNNPWSSSTGRHDLSHRQLVLLREMLNNANATVDVAAEDAVVNAEEVAAPSALSVNREWRWGDARNSTITLPSEDSTQQRGGKRRSGRMSGIRDMLKALKKTSATVTDDAPEHHHRHPAVPLLSPGVYHSTTSLSTESSAGSRSNKHRYRNLPPRILNNRRANESSTGPQSLRSASKSKTRRPIDGDEEKPSYMHSSASFSAPKPTPRRPSLASIFRNIGGSKRPASISVDDHVLPPPPDPKAHTQSSGTDTGAGDSSSNMGEEGDWDQMDSESDLDAAAKALNVGFGVDASATVRGSSVTRKLSKNRKGRSPYLQDDNNVPPLPASRPSIIQKRSFTDSQSSLHPHQHQESPTSNSLPHPPRPTRLSNVDETDFPHSPVFPSASSRPSSRISGKFGPPTTLPAASSNASANAKSDLNESGSVRTMPPHLLSASATMPAMSSSPLIASYSTSQIPVSSTTMPVIASPSLPLDWKLAMTPENIKPLLENAKEVYARLCECVEELAKLRAAAGR